MEIDRKSLDQGFRAAFERTRYHFETNLAPEQFPRSIGMPRLIGVLERWPVEAHPRFVTLFAELWAVAETARLANREPSLTEDEIYAFLDSSWAFFNSFKHK